MWSRTVGRVMGLVAGLVGFVGWVLALSAVSSQPSLHPITVVFLLVMLLAIGGVAIGAHQYNRRGGSAHLSLLIVATLLLVLGTILSGFSVGLAFLPASVIALGATLFTYIGRAARKP